MSPSYFFFLLFCQEVTIYWYPPRGLEQVLHLLQVLYNRQMSSKFLKIRVHVKLFTYISERLIEH